MLRDGHFRLYRSAFSHQIVGIARPLRFALWQWMIGEAYFKDSGELRRGQFSATNRQLADVVGMPLGTLKTFKAELVETGMVSVSRPTSARAPSVWTVSNYDEFQSKTPNPSPNPSIAINPTPADQAVTGVLDVSETATQPISQPIVSHPYKENSRTKTLEIPPNPPGGDAGASGGSEDDEDSETVRDAGGEVWPKPKPGRMNYPQEFKNIWEVWKRAQKAAPKAVKAAGKASTYELCRGHLSRGSTPEEMRSAAINYLLPFTDKTETVGCFQPPRFYRASGAEFFEYLDTSDDDIGPAPIRARWKNAGDAFRECASLSLHIGVELPTVPKRNYGPEWEDVEKFHPLILEYATDRSGFKTAPDDLAQRIEGAQ